MPYRLATAQQQTIEATEENISSISVQVKQKISTGEFSALALYYPLISYTKENRP